LGLCSSDFLRIPRLRDTLRWIAGLPVLCAGQSIEHAATRA